MYHQYPLQKWSGSSYTCVMIQRRTIAVFLLFALALPAAPASDSTSLHVFKRWLDAFNSADSTRISAFWREFGGNGADDRTSRDLRLREMTGGMTIFKVKEDSGTHLVVLMKEERGSFSESTMDLASTDPPVIARMMGHPVQPPDKTSSKALSDADLVTKVQEHVAEMHGADAFSGAILIAHRGKIVLDQAWGMANNAGQIRNTTDTQFCLGSMNKMFTAVAILQLVSQGKLALDNPIAAYWPDYPNRDLATRVTIRELLSHSGGTGDIFTPEYEARRLQIRTLADYVKLFGTRPVRFEPGTRMEYSNYGFILLGRIVELVSNESYEAYVHEHIFRPAGMIHTDARPEADQVEGRATGYIHGQSGLIPNTSSLPWSGTSAGGGYSTVGDLFLFAEALQSGKLLDPALLAVATQGAALHPDYGLGFYVLPDGAYGHGGGSPGINGELHILPHQGYVLVTLANRDPRMATDMVEFVTSILPGDDRSAVGILK
jgi:CubicO group peptidase (beta-lactamase class C family)